MVIPVGSIEPPLSFSPGRWPPVCRNWESKGAAVKRPLAGTICWVMKFSPGTRSCTDFLANWELRGTTGVLVPELIARAGVTMCNWRDQMGAHEASADDNGGLATA